MPVHNVQGSDAPVSNESVYHAYGELAPSATGTSIVISPIAVGAVPIFPPDTGEILDLYSLSAADIGPVLIEGLDVDFKTITEIVQINGTSVVQTAQVFTRVNAMVWRGSNSLVDKVLAEASTGLVACLDGVTNAYVNGVVTIPSNKRATLEDLLFSILREAGGNASGVCSVFVRESTDIAFLKVFSLSASLSGSSTVYYPNRLSSELSGPADIYLSVDVSKSNTEVSARLALLTTQK